MASSNVNYHLQICIEPSCSNPVYAKHLCRTHYQRRAKQRKVHDEVIPNLTFWAINEVSPNR